MQNFVKQTGIYLTRGIRRWDGAIAAEIGPPFLMYRLTTDLARPKLKPQRPHITQYWSERRQRKACHP